MMQPLKKVMQGTTCTVKWALGLPDIIEKLRELKIYSWPITKLKFKLESSQQFHSQQHIVFYLHQ